MVERKPVRKKQTLQQRREELEFKLTELEVTDKESYLERNKKHEEIDFRRAQAELKEKEITVQRMEREDQHIAAQADSALVYSFLEDVTDSTVKAAIQELTMWGRKYPGKPITFLLNSPGGSCIEGFALYDCLRGLSARGNQITVIAYGLAASMGALLLQAGDKRIMGNASFLMLHELSSVHWGKLCELEDDLKLTKKLWDKYLDIVAPRTKLSKAQINKRAKRVDWWLTSEEALSLGFIDEII